MAEDATTNVKVAVRCRPFNSRETAVGDTGCIRFMEGQLVMTNPATGEDVPFAFDIIFDQDSTQVSVWEAIGKPTLDKAFAGFNGTIFACKLID